MDLALLLQIIILCSSEHGETWPPSLPQNMGITWSNPQNTGMSLVPTICSPEHGDVPSGHYPIPRTRGHPQQPLSNPQNTGTSPAATIQSPEHGDVPSAQHPLPRTRGHPQCAPSAPAHREFPRHYSTTLPKQLSLIIHLPVHKFSFHWCWHISFFFCKPRYSTCIDNKLYRHKRTS
jgi:hypothetical protein